MQDALFSLANLAAIAGWLALAAAAFAPRLRQAAWLVAGRALPLALALAYALLVARGWAGASGGFDSLAAVRALFESPDLLLAGWLHYLAFDLFVGAWIARAGAEAGVPATLLLPCFALTFLFGPAGFALFVALRAARRRLAPGVLR
jgi:hypothetical protein